MKTRKNYSELGIARVSHHHQNFTEAQRQARTLSCSAVSDSLKPHGEQPARLLCPWDFPGKSTGVGCHFLLQGIFPPQGLSPHLQRLLHYREILSH